MVTNIYVHMRNDEVGIGVKHHCKDGETYFVMSFGFSIDFSMSREQLERLHKKIGEELDGTKK